MTGIKGLFDSRKASMLVLMTSLLTTLEEMGRIDPMHYTMAVTALAIVWKLAHAYEAAAKAKAEGWGTLEVVDAAMKAAEEADEMGGSK